MFEITSHPGARNPFASESAAKLGATSALIGSSRRSVVIGRQYRILEWMNRAIAVSTGPAVHMFAEVDDLERGE